jgi:hypothetical protein
MEEVIKMPEGHRLRALTKTPFTEKRTIDGQRWDAVRGMRLMVHRGYHCLYRSY